MKCATCAKNSCVFCGSEYTSACIDVANQQCEFFLRRKEASFEIDTETNKIIDCTMVISHFCIKDAILSKCCCDGNQQSCNKFIK